MWQIKCQCGRVADALMFIPMGRGTITERVKTRTDRKGRTVRKLELYANVPPNQWHCSACGCIWAVEREGIRILRAARQAA